MRISMGWLSLSVSRARRSAPRGGSSARAGFVFPPGVQYARSLRSRFMLHTAIQLWVAWRILPSRTRDIDRHHPATNLRLQFYLDLVLTLSAGSSAGGATVARVAVM